MGRDLTADEFKEILAMEPDRGTTNVRNVSSRHWQRWLSPEFRCVVPFNSFSEFNRDEGGDVWYAFDDSRPLAFFAGIWVPQWKSVRKIKEGVVATDLFAFLTTEPNAEVRPVHPKAMPVILTTPAEVETWMTAPWETAKQLLRPLPDGMLKIVSRGEKEYPPPAPRRPPSLHCSSTWRRARARQSLNPTPPRFKPLTLCFCLFSLCSPDHSGSRGFKIGRTGLCRTGMRNQFFLSARLFAPI